MALVAVVNPLKRMPVSASSSAGKCMSVEPERSMHCLKMSAFNKTLVVADVILAQALYL